MPTADIAEDAEADYDYDNKVNNLTKILSKFWASTPCFNVD